MSNTNPGGSRSKGPRAFTPQHIARACEQNRVPDVDRASGSIAMVPHQHSREQQRRLRQQQRKAARDV